MGDVLSVLVVDGVRRGEIAAVSEARGGEDEVEDGDDDGSNMPLSS